MTCLVTFKPDYTNLTNFFYPMKCHITTGIKLLRYVYLFKQSWNIIEYQLFGHWQTNCKLWYKKPCIFWTIPVNIEGKYWWKKYKVLCSRTQGLLHPFWKIQYLVTCTQKYQWSWWYYAFNGRYVRQKSANQGQKLTPTSMVSSAQLALLEKQERI